MKKAFITFTLCIFGFFSYAYANSYFDMITKPPTEQTDITSATPEVPYSNTTQKYFSFSSATKTSSTTAPVISPSQEQEKYLSWLKAQQQPIDNSVLNKENIQNLIYTIEAGLLGVGLYEIYRYK